ncbi:MAG: transglutaminase-like domain-containing protein [Nitrospirota bacterium]
MLKYGGIVVAFIWLGLLGALAPGQASEKVYPAGFEPRDEWMGIYLDGKKIGHAETLVEDIGGGCRITEDMDVVISMMGFQQSIKSVTHSEVDPSLTLKKFDFSMKSGFADMEIKGVVDGRLLKLQIDNAGKIKTKEIKLDETPHLSSDIELYLMRQGLEVGRKYRLPFFDPGTLSQQHVDIEVEGKEDLKVGDKVLPVYRVKEDYSGIESRSWINAELGAIKGDGPMGFTFLKETKEQALKPPENGDEAADIVALTSIPAKGTIPERPREVSSMRARLSGVDLSGLMINGDRQAFEGKVVSVTREDLGGLKPEALPVKDQALAKYLAPENFVQSDDPGIIAKAKEITGTETDSLKAARALSGWVYKSVEKKPSAGIPSAIEVLKSLSGDCNEHTVLYTALARAAGIPARMDAGIVMLGGRFYYHAWPEVYIGRWIAIDPTFGQFPADATHIRLIEGGPENQLSMLKVVGKLGVEVLEYK